MAPLGSLAPRLARLVLGAALILAAAATAVTIVPDQLEPSPGDRQVLGEEIRWWTPEDGWREGVRTRTLTVLDSPEGLQLDEAISGPHSPRGASFQLPISEDLRLRTESALHAGFPPTPYFATLADNVHLAVPWQDGAGTAAGAVDNMTRSGIGEVGGLATVTYRAHHADQFFVEDEGSGQVWFRAVQRTVEVEPISGTVLDHTTHEVIWRAETGALGDLPVLSTLERDLLGREKVWEATLHLTPAAQAQQADRAAEQRSTYHRNLFLAGAPLLALGELLVWRGIVGPGRREP